jgi:hypothetical protein
MAPEARAPLKVALLGAGGFAKDAYLGPLKVQIEVIHRV